MTNTTDMLICIQKHHFGMKNRTGCKCTIFLYVICSLIILLILPLPPVFASETLTFKKIADVTVGDGYDILVDESKNLCYVSFGASGVKLYDITSFSSPEMISQMNEQNNGYAHQIHKIGSTIYVGDGRAGLTVYNWTIPQSPQPQNRTLGYYGWATTSDSITNSLFLASGGDLFGFDTELVLFNISQPGQLELLDEIPIPGDCVDVEVVSGILYITGETIPLLTFNVANVSDVVELDQANENPPGSFATDIEIVGDFAYVSNWQGPFQIFSIADPSNISLIHEFSEYHDSTCVESNGEVVFLVDSIQGLVVFNVSDPLDPMIMGIYTDDQVQYRVDIVENYIFMTQLSKGFVILQINPRTISGYGIGLFIFACVVYIGLLIQKRALK